MKEIVGALTVVLLVAALAPSPGLAQTAPVQPYGARDGSVVALNVLPPGQGRYQNGAEALAGTEWEHNADQIPLYEKLVQEPDVTAETLDGYFKDATFGVKPEDIAEEYSPREGVTILRDAGFGVPHVYGTTRADTMFGAGYVSAEDRMFMMDTLRNIGRGRLSEFLGASEDNLASDEATYKTSGYTEEELQAMIDRLPTLNEELGTLAVDDVTAYAEGVNQFIAEARSDPSKLPAEYGALQIVPEDWTVTDTAAVASLIGSQLGVGGGGELENAAFLQALRKNGLSTRASNRVLGDFLLRDDPESTTTTAKRFVWNTNLGRLNKKSVALPDEAAVTARAARAATRPPYIDGPFGRIPLAFPDEMSNALLVGADLSATGRPITVFGPQTGYFSPEILMELDLHGPGIDARGVGFPGISQYVLLGRGADYAWSATSASGDQVDTFAEELCEPGGGEATIDSTGYMKDGKCVEIYSRTDSWEAKPTAGGVPPETVTVEMTTERTDNGIIQTRGMVDGKPVAFTSQRASFNKEVDSALTYVEISDPERINGAEDFQRAFARFTFTFNWFYLDSKDIAYQLGGTHPLRAKRTQPDLPVWGTGQWEWRGNLSFAGTPKDISPAKGWMTSWNNKHAPGFRASDSRYSYGPVQRVDLLDKGIKALKRQGKITVPELVKVMGLAGVTDLRGSHVLPWMLKVLGKQKDARLKTAIGLLKEWNKAGSYRRDMNSDGAYENSPAIALMDEWWERALSATFKPTLGDAYDLLPTTHHDAPGPLGSAFNGGLYSHLQKDLRTVLGAKVRGKFSRVYCGKGSLKKCRAALAASLDDAIKALEAEFGADPQTWDADEVGDQIDFRPVGLKDQPNMQWQNRPTFQQVLEFKKAKL